ncbi:Laccase-14 [Forsythia ovata]|uniref:Laccase-14 n=1 Tax=Forsythia ovata TaxID=205694 RepID=A0ABD1PVT1_9LAMI
MKFSLLHLIGFLLLGGVLVLPLHAALITRHRFVLTDTPFTRLCSNKSIFVVNGQFPGPTIYATEGDTIVVDVINQASENVTIHWHGVKQPRYPWSDGPNYITQCPIQPGSNFSQKIVLSDEIGTLWWHAHSDWSRATVHGAIVIRPKNNSNYPFRNPDGEATIILGEWWKSDIRAVQNEFLGNGGDANVSDAFLINGQPGDLYPCSRSDAAYTKPLKSDYITISPGQTIDFLLEANQTPSHYYMAARAYAVAGNFDNTTTTAIIQYKGNYTAPSSPSFPNLPGFNDTNASVNFTYRLRSLGNKNYPVDVPKNVTDKLLFTFSINLTPCPNNSCAGPFNERFRASVNNITFVPPTIAILQAYYQRIRNVYSNNFPSNPPFTFNYTSDIIPRDLWRPQNGTEVKVLKYNSTVEIVFQGTNILAGIDHPIHLHGQSFYVVGWGFGNFNNNTDPLNYNLVDPPLMNTIAVPVSGWTAVRFKANNPGT